MAIAPDLVVDVGGSGRERGRTHGEALRGRIVAGLERWDADVAARLRIDAAGHVAAFLAQTRFLDAIERHTPALLEEVRGIAEAAGVAFDRILALNLMDEEWWFSSSPSGRQACSVVAAAPRDGRPALLAQNMDLPHMMDGGQAVLRATGEDGLQTAVLTAAGMIGLTGANSAGLGVCVNALSMLRHSPAGLPVAFVIRGVLERRSLDDAAAFLRAVPHASGQHYALAAPQGAAGFECSAGGVARSDGDTGRFWHTNHPLASADLDPADDHPDGYPDSHRRMAALQTAGPGLASAADCERLLADREAPLCVLPDGDPWMTFGSVAMELSAPPVVRVAPGPPDRTEWATVTLG